MPQRQEQNGSQAGTTSDEDDVTTIDGIEHAGPVRPRKREPTTEVVRQGHRHHGKLQANKTLWEEWANKSTPTEDSEWMVKVLEKQADGRLRRTYMEGVPLNDVEESAITLNVGLTFLAGADKPQVNRLEEQSMSSKEPNQKDATWRVNTAGALLMQFDVSSDLSIIQTDQTSEVLGRAKARLQRHDIFFPEQRKQLGLRGRHEAVTIDSELVKIVDDVRPGNWDLQGLLVEGEFSSRRLRFDDADYSEVDAFSLWNLIINYKHLISRGGPDMTFEETKELLETMIEDARRLCIRSPILFRMSTRAKIINSDNTRYGSDHGPMFRTLTTSKGIREIISLSSSYYNSLDPTGEDDSTQQFIRPRFLQMMVLVRAPFCVCWNLKQLLSCMRRSL